MDLDLSGRRALITGSSGGIGRAVAQRLAEEGCAVVVHGRDRGRAEEAAAQIAATGAQTSVVVGDLTRAEDTDRICDEVAALGGVDIVVANAGPFVENTWHTADPDDWLQAFEGNVLSTVRLIRRLTPSMRATGWGRVLTIGTRATVTPLTTMVEYSAAKASVVNLTVSLAQHLAGSGVTANCVSPGVILTPSMRSMFAARPENMGAEWEDIEAAVTSDYAPNPVGRLGRPDDIASAIAFLASPLADYITGVELRVDGGITGVS
ncbi:SDR family NAD(P)-dependent oxidoreductase [Williamsia maris]|uniref:3-oxoacyl-[acyl-carrier-protein] reductase MabA n=1 Tax=Williamsia maris TaxID=72806 RepID=A0ABT1HEA9_9NOCA|nr:SDR family oxidoreductase [Williamsia maris]MCP2176036.1 NAD(P)-dependent dehydrogenase, short-chain alcohol dehydrogenase family [Williamsia maris]